MTSTICPKCGTDSSLGDFTRCEYKCPMPQSPYHWAVKRRIPFLTPPPLDPDAEAALRATDKFPAISARSVALPRSRTIVISNPSTSDSWVENLFRRKDNLK